MNTADDNDDDVERQLFVVQIRPVVADLGPQLIDTRAIVRVSRKDFGMIDCVAHAPNRVQTHFDHSAFLKVILLSHFFGVASALSR